MNFYKYTLLLLSIVLFCNTAVAATETPNMIYARGYGFLVKGNIAEARSTFEKGLQAYPEKAFFYDGIADSYLKEKNYDKASEFYLKAIEKDPQNSIYKVHYNRANIERANNTINEASLSFYNAAKASPNNAILISSINNFQEKEYNNLKLITDFYQDKKDENLTKANKARFEKNFDKALVYYKDSIVQNASNYKAYNNIGLLHLDKNDFKNAIVNFKKASEICPESAFIYNNTGVAYYKQNNYKDAFDNFEKAIKIYPTYSSAHNNKAAASISKDIAFFSNKIYDIQKIIDKEPENTSAKRVMANIYALQGQYKKAANIYRNINKIPELNFFILSEHAFYSYKLGDYKKAKDKLEKAIKLYPNNTNNYLLAARILEGNKEFEKALDSYENAMSKTGITSDVYYYYSKFLSKSDKEVESKVFMKKYIENSEQNPNAVLMQNQLKGLTGL